MLNANEAYVIAREVNRSNIELKEIISEIKNGATNGWYSITLYPSIPYHPKTIKELKQLGYEISSYVDEERHHFCYCIEWNNED